MSTQLTNETKKRILNSHKAAALSTAAQATMSPSKENLALLRSEFRFLILLRNSLQQAETYEDIKPVVGDTQPDPESEEFKDMTNNKLADALKSLGMDNKDTTIKELRKEQKSIEQNRKWHHEWEEEQENIRKQAVKEMSEPAQKAMAMSDPDLYDLTDVERLHYNQLARKQRNNFLKNISAQKQKKVKIELNEENLNDYLNEVKTVVEDKETVQEPEESVSLSEAQADYIAKKAMPATDEEITKGLKNLQEKATVVRDKFFGKIAALEGKEYKTPLEYPETMVNLSEEEMNKVEKDLREEQDINAFKLTEDMMEDLKRDPVDLELAKTLIDEKGMDAAIELGNKAIAKATGKTVEEVKEMVDKAVDKVFEEEAESSHKKLIKETAKLSVENLESDNKSFFSKEIERVYKVIAKTTNKTVEEVKEILNKAIEKAPEEVNIGSFGGDDEYEEALLKNTYETFSQVTGLSIEELQQQIDTDTMKNIIKQEMREKLNPKYSTQIWGYEDLPEKYKKMYKRYDKDKKALEKIIQTPEELIKIADDIGINLTEEELEQLDKEKKDPFDSVSDVTTELQYTWKGEKKKKPKVILDDDPFSEEDEFDQL